MSQHLAKLRCARLVRTRREGTQVFYRLENDHVAQLVTDAIHNAEQQRRRRPGPFAAPTRSDGLRSRPGRVAGHADSVDDALETSDEGVRALKISLVVLAVTAALQLVVVLLSGSVALLADTIHNVADALTAVPLWIAFAVGRRAGDPPLHLRLRPGRGPGRALRRLMIVLSASLAGVEAIRRLVDPEPMTHVGWVAVAGLIGFAGNELVALYRIRVGRRSARRRWSPTACTPAPTGSPRWPSSLGRPASLPASRSPTRSSAS